MKKHFLFLVTAVLVALAPKANGGLTLSADGELSSWTYSNPHPEISLRALPTLHNQLTAQANERLALADSLRALLKNLP